MAKVQNQKWSKDEKNVSSTRIITIRGLAKNKEFNQGYHDYRRGIWVKDYDTMSVADQWQYERGRQYAAAGGPPIKSTNDARVLRNDALWFIQNMLNSREMI